MEVCAQIKDYCRNVCHQIRWKKTHPSIMSEIETHLLDQRDAYILEGDDQNLAVQKAIAQMGDPILIGQELDKTHRPKPQFSMLILVLLFMMIGFGTNYFIAIQTGSLY